ncbi:PREDICTED: uncharacterized protein LOC105545985 [Mandrillus leucophaeus]|uniref:uncharacterized protein LOC105545985 n=1 Tax=Mandrillus leucophaeus TaxID=9568 RepID=UPI0005F392A1|nr:PREDICTED: uncharacterized protein LOC105545985 [Mandrillus leucophaeus]
MEKRKASFLPPIPKEKKKPGQPDTSSLEKSLYRRKDRKNVIEKEGQERMPQRIRGHKQRRKGGSKSEPPRRQREAEARACQMLCRVTYLRAAEGHRRNSASTGHILLPGAEGRAEFLQAVAPASSAPQVRSAQLPHTAGSADRLCLPGAPACGGRRPGRCWEPRRPVAFCLVLPPLQASPSGLRLAFLFSVGETHGTVCLDDVCTFLTTTPLHTGSRHRCAGDGTAELCRQRRGLTGTAQLPEGAAHLVPGGINFRGFQ